MRTIKKQTKSITVSGRIEADLYKDLQEFTEENDMSMSEMVKEALDFYIYCIDNEEEDSDIKDVLDTYYNVEDEDEDEDDEDDEDEDEDEEDEDVEDEEEEADDEVDDEDK